MNEYKLGQSPIVLGSLASDPSSAYNGEMYYNTTDNSFHVYVDGAWTSLGTGATGANTTLSNLTSPTAINQHLLPATAGTYNLGSSSSYWNNLYISGIIAPTGLEVVTPDSTVSQAIDLSTGNASAGSAGSIVLTTGGAVTPAYSSGSIQLIIGSATGGAISGTIQFRDGSEGTAGYIWTSTDTNGSGTWSPAPTTGANQTLSNLMSPTAINEDLLPAIDDSIDLGASAFRWANLYVTTVNNSDGDLELMSSTAVINVNSSTLTNLLDPVNPQDAATKNYVDLLAQGIAWKNPVRAVSTSPLPANAYNNGSSGVGATLTSTDGSFPAFAAVDGVTLAVNDRILVDGEATQANNGIYYLSQQGDGSSVPWILMRSLDADTPIELVAAAVYVDEGTTYASTAWVQTAIAPITIGTTALTFSKFASAVPYTFRNGLTLTGPYVDVAPGDASLVATPGSLVVQLSATGALLTVVDGVAVQVDGSTLAIVANKVQVATGGITDTQVSATAAIALSKLAALTANRVLFSDPSGVITDNSSTEPTMVVDVLKFGPVAGNVVEKQYVHAITLTDNTSSATAVDASTTFDLATYAGFQAEYYITDGSSPTIVRMGKLSIVANSDGSIASLTDISNDTGDVGVTFTAVFNTPNIELRYTTTSSGSDRTMRINIHRFLR